MRDFLPEAKAGREMLLGAIRDVYRAYGYREIETPALEDLARLETSGGGDNEKLIFRVQKRGLDPSVPVPPRDAADLGLRYDLTVPLARFYATHRAALPEVFRSVQIAPVWRGERPGRGRYRQFTQCDIDVLGEAGVVAEVELVVATLDALRRVGVVPSVRLNDRAVLDALLGACGVEPVARPAALVVVDKLDKVGLGGVTTELTGIGLPAGTVAALVDALGDAADHRGTGRHATGALDALPAPAAEAAGRLREVIAGIGRADPEARLVGDPTLVRGQGYYTGPIFELEHPQVPGSLGGGGRYDGMIGRFAGVEVPACGLSIGFERLVELVGPTGPSAGRRVALVHPPDADPGVVVAWQRYLIRATGGPVADPGAQAPTPGGRGAAGGDLPGGAGPEVRLVRRARNVSRVLTELAAEGFSEWLELPDGPPSPDRPAPTTRPLADPNRAPGGPR
jgi:histidyl-tRNA synthetase